MTVTSNPTADEKSPLNSVLDRTPHYCKNVTSTFYATSIPELKASAPQITNNLKCPDFPYPVIARHLHYCNNAESSAPYGFG